MKDAQQLLNELFYLGREVESQKEIVEKLRNVAMLKPSTISDMPKGGQCLYDEKYAILMEAEQTYQMKLTEFVNLYRLMLRNISKIDNSTYRVLLINRYFLRKPWRSVGEKLKYSVSQVYKLNKPAVAALNEKMKKKKK